MTDAAEVANLARQAARCGRGAIAAALLLLVVAACGGQRLPAPVEDISIGTGAVEDASVVASVEDAGAVADVAADVAAAADVGVAADAAADATTVVVDDSEAVALAAEEAAALAAEDGTTRRVVGTVSEPSATLAQPQTVAIATPVTTAPVTTAPVTAAAEEEQPEEVVVRPNQYTVAAGDTLFAIALAHGLNYRELALWNNLTNPDLIDVGQVLRLSPPESLRSAGQSGLQSAANSASSAANSAPVTRAIEPVNTGQLTPLSPTAAQNAPAAAPASPSAQTQAVAQAPATQPASSPALTPTPTPAPSTAPSSTSTPSSAPSAAPTTLSSPSAAPSTAPSSTSTPSSAPSAAPTTLSSPSTTPSAAPSPSSVPSTPSSTPTPSTPSTSSDAPPSLNLSPPTPTVAIDPSVTVRSSLIDPSATAPAPSGGASTALLKTTPKANQYIYSPATLKQLRDEWARQHAAPAADSAAAAPAESDEAAPAKTRERFSVTWSWPTANRLKFNFSETRKGMDFVGERGAPIYAAADGEVIYVGTGVKSYGRMVIIKHPNDYLTAYAHVDEVFVKESDRVLRGGKVAGMGDSGAESVMLHFEVRKVGKPIDPRQVLPQSPN